MEVSFIQKAFITKVA